MNEVSGGAIAFDHIEFNSLEACNKAKSRLVIQGKQSSMRWISGFFYCVSKG